MQNSCFTQIRLLLCLLLGYSITTSAQQDFNHYRPIQSVGKIPSDFLIPTSEKIREDEKEPLDELSHAKKELFVEQINFSIDQVLHSGKVTFGDPVSLYIRDVAVRLLKDDPELADHLRFYTYNSTQSNAFSTRQGIIFVTTGLLAQLTSEAQLAFVLGHEIVHYQEEHVLSLYSYAVNNKFSYGERMRFLTNYSRENELEADAKAVKMLYDAGYSEAEINKTFDALMYSYLPFEELPYNFERWNTPQFYFPPQAYDYEKKAITAKSDYNDRKMTHPNLEKRKDQIRSKTEEFKDWKQTKFFDSLRFYTIRDICRFEYIQEKLYEDSPVEALYGIQVLQRIYPESEFLTTCEAQAWLLLMKPKRKSNDWLYYSYFDRKEDTRSQYLEGEISVLDKTISNMRSIGIAAVGLRKIRDIYQSDTTNRTFRDFWKLAVKIASENDEFLLTRFGKSNFEETNEALLKERVVQDSTENKIVVWDKYEVIENNRAGLRMDKGIDTSKYYYYCIPDLMNDTGFVALVKENRAKMKSKEQEYDEFNLLTDSEQSEHQTLKYNEHLHIDMDSVLIMAPAVYEVRTRRDVDVMKSEKSRSRLIGILQQEVKRQHMKGGLLLTDSLKPDDAETWNLNTQLMRALEMAIYTEKNDVFIQDLEFLRGLKDTLGYSKILFSEYMHLYDANINPLNAVLFTVLFPVGMVYFPAAILSGHKSEWQFYILDLETGEIEVNETYLKNESAGKKFMQACINGMFNQLKQTNNEN